MYQLFVPSPKHFQVDQSHNMLIKEARHIGQVVTAQTFLNIQRKNSEMTNRKEFYFKQKISYCSVCTNTNGASHKCMSEIEDNIVKVSQGHLL